MVDSIIDQDHVVSSISGSCEYDKHGNEVFLSTDGIELTWKIIKFVLLN